MSLGFNTQFYFKEFSDLTSAISDFSESLPYQLDSIGFSDPIVKDFIEKNQISIHELDFKRKWLDIDIFCFAQMWGSTAGGWGGFGGQAFTTYYTTVIHNKFFNFINVYWNGKLAYCVHANEEAMKMMNEQKMPGLKKLHKLEVIYETVR